MRVFLKFKHWQLFIILVSLGILSAVTSDSSFWFLTFALYDFALVGWIYSIGKVTNAINGENQIINYREDLWAILFYISLIPFGYFAHSVQPNNVFFMIGAVVLESIAGIKLVNFSAKAMSQNEKRRTLTFGDYMSEFLLILFIPIGIWKIQPKMNRLIKN